MNRWSSLLTSACMLLGQFVEPTAALAREAEPVVGQLGATAPSLDGRVMGAPPDDPAIDPVGRSIRPSWRGELSALVRVSILIAPDGSVVEPYVIDSSNAEVANAATLKKIATWRFPARDNLPAENLRGRLITVTSKSLSISTSTSRLGAQKQVDALAALGEQGGVGSALVAVDQAIAQPAPASYWYLARLWGLKHRWHARAGDDSAALIDLERSVRFGRFDIASTDVLSAYEELATRYARSGRLSESLRVLEVIQAVTEKTPAQPNIAIALAEVERAVAGPAPLVTLGRLTLQQGVSQQALFFHQLARRNVSVDAKQGTIDAVDIRCDRGRILATAPKDQAFEIPSFWGTCHALVLGAEGSEISMYETNPP